MKSVNPYLYFDGRTEEAFAHYRTVFGGEYLGVLRYRDFGENGMGVSDGELDRIAHIALPIGENTLLMGNDVVGSQTETFVVGSNTLIHLAAESADEAERLFGGLAEGGRVEMPLQETEWAEQFGICVDRFGVQWIVDFTGRVEFAAG